MANNVIIDTESSGANSGEYTYSSGSPVSDVIVTHNLGGKPGLEITNPLGESITLGVEYIYIDNNSVRIILSTPETISVKFIL